MMNPFFNKITLEMSLKPFKALEDSYIENVCVKFFNQWREIIGYSKDIAVMLWSSDGSEILEYDGDLSKPFEWAYFIGGAVRCTDWDKSADPDGVGLHTTNYLYTDDPVTFRYADLQRVIETIKRVGKRIFGKNILVGAIFDPGPEFALSDFKYIRHREICVGESMGQKSMVCCYSLLHADNHCYVAYPEGVPEGTPFSEFFGKQSQRFLSDMGFDYLWLSNGFGFGTETWGITGALFDGETFDAARLPEVRKNILDFWINFRKHCNFRIETRGTNLTTGIDFATDGVDLQKIYSAGFDLLPPPNSPWAAIDGDFGLELAGYMSRIAELPENEDYLFRFYIHDPWWMNSPWLDRYERKPHDIYLPLAVSRLDMNGNVINPAKLNLLTVDDSLGNMPDTCPMEIIPHLHEGFTTRPDQPAPFIWVYPFNEYSAQCDSRLEKPFFEDSFICGAINNGFPLNTVISTDNFIRLQNSDPEKMSHSVIVTPVPLRNSRLNAELERFVKNGGRVIVYGSLKNADENLLELLGIEISNELLGAFKTSDGGTVNLTKTRTDGGSCEIAKAGGAAKVLLTLMQGETSRTAVSCCAYGNGMAGWIRGCDTSRLVRKNPEFALESYMRVLSKMFGYEIGFEKREKTAKNPVTAIHRHDNAVYYSGYVPNTTTKITFSTPVGAPLLLGYETEINGNTASYHMPRAWRAECRVFVIQEHGVVSCREIVPASYQKRRRIMIDGLENATVKVLPPVNRKIELLGNSEYPHIVGDRYTETRETTVFGDTVTIDNVSGSLLLSYIEEV